MNLNELVRECKWLQSFYKITKIIVAFSFAQAWMSYKRKLLKYVLILFLFYI